MRKAAAKPSVLEHNCPSRGLLTIVANKWAALIIHTLADGTKRYSELQRAIGGVSQKMLTQTLRNLEAAGVVHRKVYAVVPPMTEYSLTPLGKSITEPLNAICRWSEKHGQTQKRIRKAGKQEL
jgi:DNA-binding HxlR family transcriptional regulator